MREGTNTKRSVLALHRSSGVGFALLLHASGWETLTLLYGFINNLLLVYGRQDIPNCLSSMLQFAL